MAGLGVGLVAMVRAAASFQERWPWLGPDLQTLRDTIRPLPLPADRGEPITIDLEPVFAGPGPGACLLYTSDAADEL